MTMKTLTTKLLLAGLMAGNTARAEHHSASARTTREELAQAFQSPPDAARPWVYWFPLSGNLTKEGITADFEALARVGIGGVLYMEVDQGAPKGPADFAGPLWRELFQHACHEAHRLGLEINMNNDAGWCGSGGPWITPELAMQKVVWSETVIAGGQRMEVALPQPQAVKGFYRDIAVLAMPAPAGNARIPDIQHKAAFQPHHFPAAPATFAEAPPAAVIPRDQIVDLSALMDKNGRLAWDTPPGQWLVMRLGHTTTGKDNHPAPESGRGLECDKFSKAAAAVMFDGLMGKLIADNRSFAGRGQTLVSTHIDSWEVGSQNWTPKMRAEFQQRRGYDLWKFLPAFTGRVVDSVAVTERFLWDLRQTVSDLIVENYAGEFRRLANRHGLRLSIEAYDNAPVDEMTYGGQADEPMAEFWSWDKYSAAYSCTEMSSVAHTYGRKILGAEAFTATDAEKWQGHPANIKDLGDWAFCEGINRFVFHRYAAQPWTNRAPGMSMGPWGLHYERTQTWWEQSKAWHAYLARCQYLLQQGLFVADVLYLQAEGAHRFAPPADAWLAPNIRGGYNFDGCSPEVVLTRLSVKNGRLVLPDGMSYRVLVLPAVETMTPRLLRKLKELADAGATIIASAQPPQKSPSLADLGAGDAAVQKLADALWPKLVTGKTAAALLGERGVMPDFTATPRLRYIHRSTGSAEIYFVANPEPHDVEAVATFRVTGQQPELWWPDTGRTAPAAAFQEHDGVTSVPLRFEPSGSVFVVFRQTATGAAPLVSVTRDGEELLPKPAVAGAAPQPPGVTRTFTFAAWVKPEADTTLPGETNAGITALNASRNDVLYPPPGHEVWTDADAGAGLAVGRNGVTVLEHGANHFPAVLEYATPLTNWTHVAVVYRAGTPSLYLNGQLARTGLKSPFTVHGGVGVSHTRGVTPLKGQRAGLQQFDHALTDSELVKLAQTPRPTETPTDLPALDIARGEIWQSGAYILRTATGQQRELKVSLPAPQEITGPWEVSFDPKWGGPAAQVAFEKLEDWSKRPEEGIKYYSGTATYRINFRSQESGLRSQKRVYLDLGRVAVMAEVKLNGQALGILWKPPYRVEVTGALKDGENTLAVNVVNLWINRQIGDAQRPEDCDRNANGTLKSWPQWLQAGQPSPTGRFTFTSWELWKKTDPLVESGLLGPVRLLTVQPLPLPR